MNYNYGYSYGYSYGAQPSPVLSLISLAISILSLVAMWKIFVKANEPGWKCLIPIYNGYMVYKIAWQGKKFWMVFLYMFGGMVLGSVLAAMGDVLAIVGLVLMLAGMIAGMVTVIKCYIRLAHAFGKSGAFVLGLIFLAPIFMCILAFGDSEYLGPQE